MSSTRLDTAEPVALPLGNARLVSISRSGELALLKDPDGKSVLARIPIGAAGTRDLAEQVIDADWAPDGSLAGSGRRDAPSGSSFRSGRRSTTLETR